MDGGEWVLVGGARRTRRARAQQPPKRSTSKENGVAHTRAAAAAQESAPFDRDARVSAARQRAVQSRVERIAAALVAQADDANKRSATDAPMVETVLRAVARHLDWESEPQPRRRRLHVVGYGLGSFCDSTNAVYQLAFVHALATVAQRRFGTTEEPLETTLEIFDPVMNASDREIAAALDVATIDANERGRRAAAARTVFFMPHCGHALYENVVAANVAADALDRALILGNSFAAYGDRLLDAASRRASLVLAVLPFVAESPLPLGVAAAHDEFHLYEAAFNDLSIHTFSPAQAAAARGSAAVQALVARAMEASSPALATAIDRELLV